VYTRPLRNAVQPSAFASRSSEISILSIAAACAWLKVSVAFRHVIGGDVNSCANCVRIFPGTPCAKTTRVETTARERPPDKSYLSRGRSPPLEACAIARMTYSRPFLSDFQLNHLCRPRRSLGGAGIASTSNLKHLKSNILPNFSLVSPYGFACSSNHGANVEARARLLAPCVILNSGMREVLPISWLFIAHQIECRLPGKSR
jgi:hypothetical protein